MIVNALRGTTVNLRSGAAHAVWRRYTLLKMGLCDLVRVVPRVDLVPTGMGSLLLKGGK